MTTQPEESSREVTILPVEQLAGHDVGTWITFEHPHHGHDIAGYLTALAVNRAVIDDTALCEAKTRFIEQNQYELEVYAQGRFRLRGDTPITIEPADPSLGVVMGRVQDALKLKLT